SLEKVIIALLIIRVINESILKEFCYDF
ncbi:MAG: hypothetical protein RLZZ419_980, partial [Pseudomonadota bacterium]